MTACIPDEPTYCFAPVTDADGEPPQIRILVEGLGFAVPTALVALSQADGLAVCDRLNSALGLRPRRLDGARRALPARRRGGQHRHPLTAAPPTSLAGGPARGGRPGGGGGAFAGACPAGRREGVPPRRCRAGQRQRSSPPCSSPTIPPTFPPASSPSWASTRPPSARRSRTRARCAVRIGRRSTPSAASPVSSRSRRRGGLGEAAPSEPWDPAAALPPA